ncbi:MAG TPA: helix-turn-helix domain-containing protein [Candidatus Aminicenantes bacterium]|nr:helix-turn-helix domain-containing protein [Candidatus Aminicenantes bacterium]
MIEPDKRKAIYLLHQEGKGLREIARLMDTSHNTVAAIIEQKGEMPHTTRRDKIRIDADLLRRLYGDCEGWIQRVHEKLVEEEGIRVTYPTLTRMLRDLGINTDVKARCERVPDEPGAEFQHDTSPYQLKLGDKPTRVVGSLLYLRYSKRRYLKFYCAFNRFKMKCFFHEALMFWGYSAAQCIIDNTNLARLRGTGREAVMVPEMEAFAKQYGFQFVCHEKGHANRKAGEERSFWTVETNFFPGRVFQNLEDLNRQALEWSTVRMEQRPQGETKIIPAQIFEYERPYLIKLTPHIPPPYMAHHRGTDEYGFASFDGNHYWVPGTKRGEVKILEYSHRLTIYAKEESPLDYRLPASGVKHQRFSPEGQPPPPHAPRHRQQPTQQEELRLRAMGQGVGAYLDFVLKPKGLERHGMIRKLFAISQKMTPALFIRSIERAHKYKITSLETIERIAVLCMSQGEDKLLSVEVDERFRDREAYQEGYLTDPPNLSIYDDLLKGEDHG